MTDPNVNASAQSVADTLAGTDGDGNGLSFTKVSRLYPANLLGLAKDYAEPEGPNTGYSKIDDITTLAKVLTRTYKSPVDGNTYDLWDATITNLKANLLANRHINDDEVNSVNHKPSS